jgi:hypothetical protein
VADFEIKILNYTSRNEIPSWCVGMYEGRIQNQEIIHELQAFTTQ